MASWMIGVVLGAAMFGASRYCWKKAKNAACTGNCAGCGGCGHKPPKDTE